MFSLSREEESLKMEVLKLVSSFLKSYTKPKPKILGLITQDELLTELNIKYGTVKRWEELVQNDTCHQLKARALYFHKIDDILIFLGVEK